MMQVIDVTNSKMVATQVKMAEGMWQRLKGLLGTKTLDPEQGLWIPKCQGIHTFGMQYAIDVVYLDEEWKAIDLVPSIEPNRMGPVCPRARSVIELPAGTIERKEISIGDVFCFTCEGSEQAVA